ncbi:GNAT family N-acetyltransferase [Luteimicrobium subarcticum]|uniref:GNAT family N-acetyltransferase n=1 Tax=Luteimicrobium subarcticum TaxID=620910 RepID=UPI001FE243EC|nr:GNAT family N-acetyltransferase [Luteimicrobium subarcticum]
MPDDSVLDNPVLSSLEGFHSHLARRQGRALAFPADVAPFTALPLDATAADWDDLGSLVGAGAQAWLAGDPRRAPDGWTSVARLDGVQMVAATVDAQPDDEALVLGPDDVPDILDLVSRTRPGPFLPRTIEVGRYLGIRREGALVALAGERLRPPGFTEVSAVCTDPAVRGQGLAGRLVRAVVAGVEARGDVAVLHATADNPAVGLYRTLGFVVRRAVTFEGFTAP